MATIHIDHSQASPGKAIINEWMQKSMQTLAAHDAEGHLALISKEVVVHGVPELETINYNDWAAQVRHEFANKLVKSVVFHGDRIRVENPEDIMFNTLEVITASDGSVLRNGLEVVLKKESDGVWRVIQERILNKDEMQHYGLSEN